RERPRGAPGTNGRLEVAKRLAAGARGQCGPGRWVNAIADKANGAIAKGGVDAAVVTAAGGGPDVAVGAVPHASQRVAGWTTRVATGERVRRRGVGCREGREGVAAYTRHDDAATPILVAPGRAGSRAAVKRVMVSEHFTEHQRIGSAIRDRREPDALAQAHAQ